MNAVGATRRPLISVVTATRNAETQIAACLANVAAQPGADYEHWIVDGASTDRTAEILRAQTDPRVHWISDPDQGIYDAFNKAVRLVAGEWILFLGADDRLRPDALWDMSAWLQDPRTIYYGDVWMPGRRKRYAGRFGPLKLALKNICQQAIFYPRAVFASHQFDLAYSVQADWVLNMACRKDPALRFEYVPLVVTDFEDRAGASSTRRDLALERDYAALVRRHFPAWIAWPLTAAVAAWRFARGKQTP